MLETTLILLQQQKTIRSNKDIFESHINNLCRPLEVLGQETLKLEAELGGDIRKSKDEINRSIEMENKFVLIKKDVD